ncbi:hypothetical protein Lepto7375DRAFT_7417 [Leptolyngbya sp. PCC 7375]|nr:hypothetical protein Lepto7375DRAFT_7417 [Leptolyngbya sp. PCC 7375]
MDNGKIVSKIDVLNLFREESRWDGSLTHRGMARLAGVHDHSTLVSGGDIKSKSLARKLMGKGFDPGDIAKNGWSAKAAFVCLTYYAYNAKKKSEQAEHLAEAFGPTGLVAVQAEALGKMPAQNNSVKDAVDKQIANLERIMALIQQLPNPSPLLLQAAEDRIRDLLAPPSQNQLAPATEKTEWTIRDRLEYREIRGCENYESPMGRLAAKKYREKYNKDPLKGHRIFNGKQRKCTVYMVEDVDLIDAAIDEYLAKKLGGAQ